MALRLLILFLSLFQICFGETIKFLGHNITIPEEASDFYVNKDNETLTILYKEDAYKPKFRNIKKRQGCTYTTIDKTEHFNSWDKQLSPVFGKGQTMTITQGYSVTNSIGWVGGADWTIVEDFLRVSTGISYTKSWTSSYQASSSYKNEGNANTRCVHVVNAFTRRDYGSIYYCNGVKKSSYMADAYFDGPFNFVSGDYQTQCYDGYPVKFRYGEGWHY